MAISRAPVKLFIDRQANKAAHVAHFWKDGIVNGVDQGINKLPPVVSGRFTWEQISDAKGEINAASTLMGAATNVESTAGRFFAVIGVLVLYAGTAGLWAAADIARSASTKDAISLLQEKRKATLIKTGSYALIAVGAVATGIAVYKGISHFLPSNTPDVPEIPTVPINTDPSTNIKPTPTPTPPPTIHLTDEPTLPSVSIETETVIPEVTTTPPKKMSTTSITLLAGGIIASVLGLNFASSLCKKKGQQQNASPTGKPRTLEGGGINTKPTNRTGPGNNTGPGSNTSTAAATPSTHNSDGPPTAPDSSKWDAFIAKQKSARLETKEDKPTAGTPPATGTGTGTSTAATRRKTPNLFVNLVKASKSLRSSKKRRAAQKNPEELLPRQIIALQKKRAKTEEEFAQQKKEGEALIARLEEELTIQRREVEKLEFELGWKRKLIKHIYGEFADPAIQIPDEPLKTRKLKKGEKKKAKARVNEIEAEGGPLAKARAKQRSLQAQIRDQKHFLVEPQQEIDQIASDISKKEAELKKLIDAAEIKRIEERLAEIKELLTANPSDKAALVNEQETIQTILDGLKSADLASEEAASTAADTSPRMSPTSFKQMQFQSSDDDSDPGGWNNSESNSDSDSD